jgi:transposase
MTLRPEYVGIDVSKATLDVFESGSGRALRIANEPAAIAAQAATWRQRGSFVIFEATGSYDRALRTELQSQAVPFARVNPTRARDFARAAGFLAKTDAVDARMLAAMGQCLQPAAHQPRHSERERLVALHRRRDQLVAMRAQERARASGAESQEERLEIDSHLAWLTAAIKTLDRRIQALFAQAEQLNAEYQRLRSAPGIGPVAATTLVALLPELGQRNSKTIAALVGLAPLNCDTGQHRGSRHIAGGRKRVRDALYMAALAATRHSPRFKTIYDAMLAKGKAPKLALIAIARKLLLALNAMARNQVAYA